MLSEVKERLEGPKYNIDLRGKGIGMSTMQKGSFYRSVLTLLSLIVVHPQESTKQTEIQHLQQYYFCQIPKTHEYPGKADIILTP